MSIREPALGTSTVNIFVSYAHEDHSWCNVFRKHVSYISRDHKVNLFSDADISPGTDWKELILSKIRAADIFIVLLTKNFAASDFCNDVELALATINESAQVIPIVLEHMDFGGSSLSRFQALPYGPDKRILPVKRWKDRDEAFQLIAGQLRDVIRSVSCTKQDASGNLKPLNIDAVQEQKMHGFIARHINTLEECAYLRLAATQGSGKEIIGLNAELRMGQQRLKCREMILLIRLRMIRLKVDMEGCEIPKGRNLGDYRADIVDDVGHLIRRKNPTLWEVERRQGSAFLDGYILGDENLCDVEVTESDHCRVRALLTVYRENFEVELTEDGEAVCFGGRLTETKKKLLKIIVSKVLGSMEDELLLSECYLEGAP